PEGPQLVRALRRMEPVLRLLRRWRAALHGDDRRRFGPRIPRVRPVRLSRLGNLGSDIPLARVFHRRPLAQGVGGRSRVHPHCEHCDGGSGGNLSAHSTHEEKSLMDLAANLERVRARIRAAAERAGREASGITLVAVTKVFPASAIREAWALGLRNFGENYLQEFEGKFPE